MNKHLEAMDKWLENMEEITKALVDSMKEMWDNFDLLQDFDQKLAQAIIEMTGWKSSSLSCQLSHVSSCMDMNSNDSEV